MSAVLRVIGDVHGELEAFAGAVTAPPAPGFVVQLGDLVDRGPDSAGCVALALDLVDGGTGMFLRGNHDDKLARLLQGNPVRAGAELQRTTAQLRAADASLIARFLVGWENAPWWLLMGDHLFVHGAFHPAMIDHPSPAAIPSSHTRKTAQWLALYGEGRMQPGETLPQRTYGWVDTVPMGLTVVVGHDVRSEDAPLTVVNAAGGRAIFLDTGCGKGGRLSWLDLPMPPEAPRGITMTEPDISRPPEAPARSLLIAAVSGRSPGATGPDCS